MVAAGGFSWEMPGAAHPCLALLRESDDEDRELDHVINVAPTPASAKRGSEYLHRLRLDIAAPTTRSLLTDTDADEGDGAAAHAGYIQCILPRALSPGGLMNFFDMILSQRKRQ
jgi:hypothetical protein